jgi:N-acetylglucosamine-6-sulfatase
LKERRGGRGAEALVAACLVAGALLAAPPAAPAAARPNVVVLMTDDQTVEQLRVMSNVRGLLAAQGTTYRNSFVSYPLCCPSRATFLTGQYPHNHRVLYNGAPTGGFRRLNHENTLPVWLHDAGYYTGHLGQYLNGYFIGVARKPPPPGWNEWGAAIDPSSSQMYGYTLNENRTLVTYGHDPVDYQTDVLAAKSVDFIRRKARAKAPFFLNVWFLAPHLEIPEGQTEGGGAPSQLGRNPRPAPRHEGAFLLEPPPMPPSFDEEDVSDKPQFIRNNPRLTEGALPDVIQRYRDALASLLAVDDAVGTIVSALSAVGELNRTVIIFTSDNGFFYGQHRIPSGKYLPYEEAIRVPLIIRGPGFARGASVYRPVANIDLAPTIARIAGAKTGRTVDGITLLRGGSNGLRQAPGRDLLIATGANNELFHYHGIRTPNYLYVEHSNGSKELYDMRADPYQLQNRVTDGRYARIRGILAGRLQSLRRCKGDACRKGPRTVLRVRSARRKRGRGCLRKPLVASLRGRDVRIVDRANFRVAGGGGALLGVREEGPFRVNVPGRRLKGRRSATVRAGVELIDGRSVTLSRRAKLC